MERRIDNLKPNFLRKLDTYLLENHPLVWMSRVHYIAAFVAVMYFVVLMQVFFGNAENSNVENLKTIIDPIFLLFVAIVVLLFIFGYWVYHLYHFSISKYFGEKNKNFNLNQLGWILLGNFLLFTFPLFSALIIGFRGIEFFYTANALMPILTFLSICTVIFMESEFGISLLFVGVVTINLFVFLFLTYTFGFIGVLIYMFLIFVQLFFFTTNDSYKNSVLTNVTALKNIIASFTLLAIISGTGILLIGVFSAQLLLNINDIVIQNVIISTSFFLTALVLILGYLAQTVLQQSNIADPKKS